jgi:hypothetical protein
VIKILAGRGDDVEQELFWFGPLDETSSLLDAVLGALRQRVQVEDYRPGDQATGIEGGSRMEIRASGLGCVEDVLGERVGNTVVGTETAIVVRDRDGLPLLTVPWDKAAWFRSDRLELDLDPKVFPAPSGQWIHASPDDDRWRLLLQPDDVQSWVTLFLDHGVPKGREPFFRLTGQRLAGLQRLVPSGKNRST